MGLLGCSADNKGDSFEIDFRRPWSLLVETDVDVARQDSSVLGGSPGLRYRSSGFKVQIRDAAELIDLLRLSFSGDFHSIGTSRTLTSWPGSNGQNVVKGSA